MRDMRAGYLAVVPLEEVQLRRSARHRSYPRGYDREISIGSLYRWEVYGEEGYMKSSSWSRWISCLSEDRLWWYGPRRRARIPDASGRKAHLVSSFFFSMFTYNLTACIVSSQNPHVSCLSRLLTLNITFILYYRSQPGNEPLVPRTFEVPLYDIANAMRLSVCLFVCFFFFLHHFLSSSSALFFSFCFFYFFIFFCFFDFK